MTTVVYPRSYLFVPGHKPALISKALRCGADAVIIDMEDAVPPHLKAEARQQVLNVLTDQGEYGSGPQVWLRINETGSTDAEKDIATFAGLVFGFRVPKANRPSDVEWAAARADGAPLIVTIETARGVTAACDIAEVSTVVRLGLGGMDLIRDLGCSDDELPMLMAKSEVVIASRAAELPGPIHSVYPYVHDKVGMSRHAAEAARLGYTAQSILSPRQIPAVHEAFSVDEAQRNWACEILEEFAASGGSPTQTAAGEFVDLPVAKRAQDVLNRAEAMVRGRGWAASVTTSP
jgi:citrate lyase subunit beta / citryl-CoA lyase